MNVPVVVVQKSGHENAQLVADMRRHGFENGVHYKVVEYVEQIKAEDPRLSVVFLGQYWGSASDREIVRNLTSVRTDVLVTSFEEMMRREGGVCHLRAVPGTSPALRYVHLGRIVASRQRSRERHF